MQQHSMLRAGLKLFPLNGRPALLSQIGPQPLAGGLCSLEQVQDGFQQEEHKLKQG